MYDRKKNDKLKVYISLISKKKGGGANTFTQNFKNWIKKNNNRYALEKNIFKADKAIIIADKAELDDLQGAKKRGCFVIHRLDEYFEESESEYRKYKHKKIIKLNQFANVTVYQSKYVYNNAHKYINAKHYVIIINGADPKIFYPSKEEGKYIGHVSWSADERKRFDYLYELIKEMKKEKFILIGNHSKTKYPFENFDNVELIGVLKRKKIGKYYHKMKILLLPSEKDPCPNTAVESILSGIPVCYNSDSGTEEIVKDCGVRLEELNELLKNVEQFRKKCFQRKDLYFDSVAKRYMSLD